MAAVNGNLTTPRRSTVRCAIYTRKSTEEGLEQEFNTLDAQRDAAEAFIRSQRGEGWVALEEHYDDGGFTGANMDRPALQKLLQDVRDGLVDCVMVYKVDRLTRSLLDFARIMEVHDKHGVRFLLADRAFASSGEQRVADIEGLDALALQSEGDCEFGDSGFHAQAILIGQILYRDYHASEADGQKGVAPHLRSGGCDGVVSSGAFQILAPEELRSGARLASGQPAAASLRAFPVAHQALSEAPGAACLPVGKLTLPLSIQCPGKSWDGGGFPPAAPSSCSRRGDGAAGRAPPPQPFTSSPNIRSAKRISSWRYTSCPRFPREVQLWGRNPCKASPASSKQASEAPHSYNRPGARGRSDTNMWNRFSPPHKCAVHSRERSAAKLRLPSRPQTAFPPG